MTRTPASFGPFVRLNAGRRLTALAAATALALGATSAVAQTVLLNNPLGDAAVAAAKTGGIVRQGNSFAPPGSNFTLFAEQGVDNSHPFGVAGVTPQVNQNFEIAGSTGVTYDLGNNHLTDFGLGLFQNSQHVTQSTGLHIAYNTLVDAASVTLTVEDFDLKSNATGFDSKKVEPLIFVLGPGNVVLATADPASIFPVLMPFSSGGGKKADDDVWTINIGDLLASLHLADGPISGIVLAADMADGEKSNSDPYLLVSVSNGTSVPEPGSAVLVIGSAVAAWITRRLCRRTSAS